MDINIILSLAQTIIGLVSLILTIAIPQKKETSLHIPKYNYYTNIIIDNDNSNNKNSIKQAETTSTPDDSLNFLIFAGTLIISAFFFFVLQKIFFTLMSLIVTATVICVSLEIRKKQYLLTKLHKSYIYVTLLLILVSTMFIPINYKTPDGYGDFLKQWMNTTTNLGFSNIYLIMQSIVEILANFLKLFWANQLTGYFILFKISGFIFLLINVINIFKLFLKLLKEKPIHFTNSYMIGDIVISIISILFLSGSWLIIYENYLKPFFTSNY